jgi:hypothetical protein
MRICIIGSGFGASVLTKVLAKTNHDIDVIDINEINNFSTRRALKVIKSSVLNVKDIEYQYYGWGGGSNLWHGVNTFFDNSEFKKYKKISIDFKKIYLKYNSKSLKFIEVISNFKKKQFLKYNRYNQVLKKISTSGLFNTKNFIVQNKPYNVKKYFLELLKKKRIKLVENSVVLKFQFKNKRITAVEIFNIKKKKIFILTYDIFVLCSGAIESPRILLQTFKKNHESSYDKLGLGITDHFKSTIGVIKSRDSSSYYDFRINKKENARIGFVPKKNVKGNYCVIFRPFINLNYAKFTTLIKLFIKKKNINNIINLISNLSFLNIFYIFSRILCRYLPIEASKVEIWTEAKQSESNYIYLTNRFDNYGRKIPKLVFNFSDFEKNQIIDAQNNISNIFNSKKDFFFKKNNFSLKNISSGSHFANTCRIGRNIKDSVVNKNLKIHNFHNLYICDNSVLNYTGNSNPTLSLMNLAFRLGYYLIKKLKITKY